MIGPMTPTPLSFDVPGGTLHGLRFGTGPRIALAVHGITASAMAWPAVAAALPEDWSLVALDLRGRGDSRELPGPFGLAAHAADVNTVAAALLAEGSIDGDAGGDTALALVGHSMGAYVSVLAVDARPELYRRVVLVDGGVPLPLPEGADPDELLAATLGPALERLRTTYASADEYVAFFRQHPALGPSWDDTIEGYVRYDVLETPDGVRSRAVDAAVRADGRDLLLAGPALDAALRADPAADLAAGRPGRDVRPGAGAAPGRGRRGVRRRRAGRSPSRPWRAPTTTRSCSQEAAARRVAAAVIAQP